MSDAKSELPSQQNRVRDQQGEAASGASSKVSRRAIVGTVVGVFGAGYAGAISYPIYRYLKTPLERANAEAQVTEVSLPEGVKLKPGSALPFRFGLKPAVLIHHEDGTWSAFNAVCTHLGCTVKYEPDRDRIFCACHGGVYDSRTGQPIAGPPPRALTEYKVEVQDDRVVVSRA